MNLKTILITLTAVAVFLGIITYFVVFFSAGTTIATNVPMTTLPGSTSTFALPTSTVTSSIAVATGTESNSSTSNTSSGTSNEIGGGTTSGAPVAYSSDFASPPVTWNEGDITLGITGASFDGVDTLTLTLQVAMSSSTECVPMDLRFVADESGDLQPPTTPQFTFHESGTCNGAAGATYNDEPVSFTVNPTSFPLLFTTGGASDVFFNVATTSFGGLDVEIPQQAG